MKQELEAALHADFPDLYRELRWGFECDDGWEPLIRRLSEKLKGTDTGCVQVKEKFGGLRFYVYEDTEPSSKAIDDAEAESFKTCEVCGSPGSLRRRGSGSFGWLKTLCHPCFQEWVKA